MMNQFLQNKATKKQIKKFLQRADQGKQSIEEQTNVEKELQGDEKSTDATNADQEEDQVNPSYQNQTNIEEEDLFYVVNNHLNDLYVLSNKAKGAYVYSGG